eukprot:gene14840-19946_t
MSIGLTTNRMKIGRFPNHQTFVGSTERINNMRCIKNPYYSAIFHQLHMKGTGTGTNFDKYSNYLLKSDNDDKQQNQSKTNNNSRMIINDRITQLFSSNKNVDENEFKNNLLLLIEEYPIILWDRFNMLLLLHKTSKTNINVFNILPTQINTDSIMSCLLFIRKNKQKFTSQDITRLLYSLKVSSFQNTVKLEQLLLFITKITLECSDEFNAQEIGNSLYGLQKISGNSEGLKSLLKVLATKIDQSNVIMTGQELSNAFYGLRRLSSSEVPEVLLILTSLARKIEESDSNSYNSLQISNILNGLQGMSSSHKETLLILSKLYNKIKQYENNNINNNNTHLIFSSRFLGSSFMGLRKMTSDHVEVQNILSLLYEKLLSCPDMIENNHVTFSSIMNGLQNMNDNNEIIRKILTFLTSKISLLSLQSKTPGDGVHISGAGDGQVNKIKKNTISLNILANSLIGLSNMNSKSFELQSFISSFMLILLKNNIIIQDYHNNDNANNNNFPSVQTSPQSLAIIFYSLKSFDLITYPDLKVLLLKIYEIINELLTNNNDDNNNIKLWKFTDQHYAMMLYGLQNILTSYNHEVIHNANNNNNSTNNNAHSSKYDNFVIESILDMIIDLIDIKNSNKEIKQINNNNNNNNNNKIISSFSPQAMSMSMIGLRPMITQQPISQIKQLIKILSTKISLIDGQSCGNILYSLSKTSCDVAEIRSFLNKFTNILDTKINHNDKNPILKLNAQELSNSYYGLSNMDSKYSEVKKLIHLLLKLFKQSNNDNNNNKLVFTSQGIANSISGFQSMSCEDSKDIIETLGLLADKIEENNNLMSPQDISNTLFGLQGMTSDYEEIRAIVIALLPKIRACDETFNTHHIGYCLTGLNGMQRTVYQEIEDIFQELYIKIAKSEYGGQPNLLFLQFGKAVRVKVNSNALLNYELSEQYNNLKKLKL